MKKLFALALLSLGLLAPLCSSFETNDFAMAKADNENTISLTCDDSLTEGNSYWAYVNLRAYEQISALSVEVHFDDSVITVNNEYNSIDAAIYDSSIHEDYVAFSYIFNSIDIENSQRLFYFYFTINNPIVAGDYYFDVVVTEAYGTSLNDVEISTSRKNFSVANRAIVKSAHGTLNTYSISTSIEDEFSFSYSIDSLEPSSGTFIVTYDDELFEFVSLSRGNFFENMLFDYNAATVGEIYISFAAVTAATNYSLFTITLRTIANVNDASSVTLGASELYDSEMNIMSFSTPSLTVNISYNRSYETNPAMETSYTLDTSNHTVTIDITLEENSHLGAGDFTLTFDDEVFTYVSYTKNFAPTSFTVNDKDSQLSQGQVKFSILSLTDIMDAEDVITFVFSYEESRNNRDVTFGLTGSVITDSLTNPIELDISGTNFTINGVDFITRWAQEYLFMDDPSFIGDGTGRCLSEGLYNAAKTALLQLDEDSITDFANNDGNRYTDALARYLAWARACHDNTPFDNVVILNTITVNPITNTEYDYSPLLAVLIVSITTMTFVTLFFVIKKKKKR